ncbi:uncharacterized protein LOC136026946 [Artemia franciscana]|uniref:uncharacterized protein LOC136026946 n=1 Tax=Artemia franciscana TaxID=6661 RepID=UPI0032DBEBAB
MAHLLVPLFCIVLINISTHAAVTNDEIVTVLDFKDGVKEKYYKISGLKDHVAILKEDLEELNWRFLNQQNLQVTKRQHEKFIEESVDSLNDELENLAVESEKLLSETERFLKTIERKYLNKSEFGSRIKAMLKLANPS